MDSLSVLLAVVAAAAVVFALISRRAPAVVAPSPEIMAALSELKGVSTQTGADLSSRLDRVVSVANETAAIAKTGSDHSAALRGLLGNSARRGSWGEDQLMTALAASGLQFDAQLVLADGSRPDAVIHLPNGVRMIVDAKAPLDKYEAMWKADQEGRLEDRLVHAKAHATAVKAHIQELSNRGYQHNLPGSLPFIVMFLPAVGSLGEAYEASPDLLRYAASRDIVLADPISLQGFLSIGVYLRKLWELPDSWADLTPKVDALHLAGEEIAKSFVGARRALAESIKYMREGQAAAERVSDSRNAIGAITGSGKPSALPGNWPKA